MCFADKALKPHEKNLFVNVKMHITVYTDWSAINHQMRLVGHQPGGKYFCFALTHFIHSWVVHLLDP